MGKGIGTIKKLISKNDLNDSIVVHFLTLIRKELEILDESDREFFDVLKFYCDWALHTAIDRSKSGSSIISNINQTIAIYQHSSSNEELIRAISILLINKLKNQLSKFLDKHSIQTNIISEQTQWRHFLLILFSILEHTQVCLHKTHKQYLQNNPIKQGMWICEIKIVKQNFHSPLSSNYELIYALDLLTSDTTRIIVPLII
ncbi:TPA: hypothetical protein ACMWW0_001961 [Legionella pneumophila]|nr:hypothetical protein [Legionella pneumophila]HBD9260109.1 hypothetical protein [Legionella pneumophila]HCX3262839.1 hypothetical protein [Legionella pneumophila]HCX3599063.1 hypothetical protein [Legionella pneumophila]HDI4841931.1 hypothetical protein [Legionella pneumophila]